MKHSQLPQRASLFFSACLIFTTIFIVFPSTSHTTPQNKSFQLCLSNYLENLLSNNQNKAKNFKTKNIIKLLNRPVIFNAADNFGQRWNAIDTIKINYNWRELSTTSQTDPRYKGFSKAKYFIDRYRQETSATIKGEVRLEIGNEQAASYNWLIADSTVQRWLSNREPLSIEKIKTLNKILGEGLNFNNKELGNPGEFRRLEAYAGRTEYMPAEDVPYAMERFMDWYKYNAKRLHPIQLAAKSYEWLLTIHPFGDANGRTTRMVLDWILQMHGYPPAVFKNIEGSYTALFFDIKDNNEPIFSIDNVTEAVENSLSILKANVPSSPAPTSKTSF